MKGSLAIPPVCISSLDNIYVVEMQIDLGFVSGGDNLRSTKEMLVSLPVLVINIHQTKIIFKGNLHRESVIFLSLFWLKYSIATTNKKLLL